MSGRKRKAIDQMLEDGNKSHLTKKEIEERKAGEEKLKELASDKIRPPTWLNKNSKKIFKSIVNELKAIDLLANVDVHTLSILSDAIDKYIQTTNRLDESDIMIEHTNKFGATNLVENPLIRTQLKYAELIKKYSSEFGLTMAARLKLITINREESDGFDEDFF